MKQAKRTLAILALVIVAGCTMQVQPATPPDESITTLHINSTYATTPLLDTLTEAYLDSQADVVFARAESNHTTNLHRLQNGETAYFVSNHLSQPADTLLWAAPLAQDGLVIITHIDNPVSNLSMEQVRRIYRGYITNWQDVGGADLNITPISREAGSGTRAEFERLVMGQQRTSPNAQVVPSPIATLHLVLDSPGAIAYLPLSQLTHEIHLLSIDDITPSLETIANSRYPLRYTIYIIGLSEPDGHYRNFIGWMQGTEGQQMLRSRYAPLP